MMNPTNLSLALWGLIARRKITATQLAAEVGLNQSTVSRACSSEPRRIDIPTLRALCSGQLNQRDGLELLLAHLRDEVERAGRTQTEVSIVAAAVSPDDDIAVLAAEMRDGNAELIALIRDMAQLARMIRRTYPKFRDNPESLKVAEE